MTPRKPAAQAAPQNRSSSPRDTKEQVFEDRIRQILIENRVSISSRLVVRQEHVQAQHDAIVKALLTTAKEQEEELKAQLRSEQTGHKVGSELNVARIREAESERDTALERVEELEASLTEAVASLETLGEKLHNASDTDRACATAEQFINLSLDPIRAALDTDEGER